MVYLKNKKYLTLKEAASIYGYTPDHIGWLIRNGKIKGKKFHNIFSWQTTLNEVTEYCRQNNSFKKRNGLHNKKNSRSRKNSLSLEEAAKISGYTPDYVGFLIRTGKIKGKKILGKASWLISDEEFKKYHSFKKYKKIKSQKLSAVPQIPSSEVEETKIQNSTPATIKSRILNFGFRFVIAVSIACLFIFGSGPARFLQASARAIFIPEQKVAIFYANSAVNEQSQDQIGWQNPQNVQGQPDVDPDGDIASFSESNSAVYKTGPLSIILQDFRNSEEESPANQSLQNSESTGTDQILEGSSVEQNSGSVPEIKTGTTSTDEIINPKEEPISSQDVQNSEATGTKQILEEPPSEQGSGFVPEATMTATGTDEIISKAETSRLKSFSTKLKQFFGVETAGAQEMSQVFKSAKIKFSFAIGEKDASMMLKKQKAIVETEDTLLGGNNLSEKINNFFRYIFGEKTLVVKAEETQGAITSSNSEVNNLGTPGGEFLTNEATTTSDYPNNTTTTETSNNQISIEDKLPAVVEKAGVVTSSAAELLSSLDTKIIVWWSLDGINWQTLGTISEYPLSNASNGGYFEYAAPFLTTFEDIKNLRIKFEGVVGGETNVVSYLDSAWVEVKYEEQAATVQQDENIELVSQKNDFQANEEPELKFKYRKGGAGFLTSVGETLGVVNYWQDKNVTAEIQSPGGETIEISSSDLVFDNSGNVSIKLSRQLFKNKGLNERPGHYKLILRVEDNSTGSPQTIETAMDFSWGVLAVNVNKSIYLSAGARLDSGSAPETAFLQMAALGDDGHTICDANLILEVTDPSGATTTFKTNNQNASSTIDQQNLIEQSGDCGPNNVTDKPDYSASYEIPDQIGTYRMRLEQMDADGITRLHEMNDQFAVRNSVPFDVERIGPTRIYPPAVYQVIMPIKVNQDFSGEVIEKIPAGFKVQHIEYITNGETSDSNYRILDFKDWQEIRWKVDWKTGESHELRYQFDAPEISPYLFQLGPLSFNEVSDPINLKQDGLVNFFGSLSDTVKNVESIIGNSPNSSGEEANRENQKAIGEYDHEKAQNENNFLSIGSFGAENPLNESAGKNISESNKSQNTSVSDTAKPNSSKDRQSFGQIGASIFQEARSWLIASDQVSPNGLLVWDSTTVDSVFLYQTFTDPGTWSNSAISSTTAASQHYWIKVKSAPTRNEKIAAALTQTGVLYVQTWNGTSWTAQFNVAGVTPAQTCTGTVANCRAPFSIAYEQLSGRAIVTYGKSGTNNQFFYRIWDGSSWVVGETAVTYSTANTTSTFMSLKAKGEGLTGLRSNEMLLSLDSMNDQVFASYWNGSSFATGSTDSTTTAGAANCSEVQCADVAWESVTGRGMLALGKADGTYGFLGWTSANGWVAGGSMAGASTPGWGFLRSDPASDRIAFLADELDTVNDVYVYIWRPTSTYETWFNAGSDTSVEVSSAPTIAMDWQKKGSRLVGIIQDSSTVMQRDGYYIDCNSTACTTTGPTTLTEPSGNNDAAGLWVVCSPNSSSTNSGVCMSPFSDIDSKLFSDSWKGTAWGVPAASRRDAGTYTGTAPGGLATVRRNMPYNYSWTPYSPWSLNWRWTDDMSNQTPANANWLAATDTAPTGIDPSSKSLRLRFNMAELGGQGQTDVRKTIQYTSGCTPNSSETGCTWTDVADSAAFKYCDGPGTDDSNIPSTILPSSTTVGPFVENGTAASVYDHAASAVAEWDFCLKSNNASYSTTYYFRAYDSSESTQVFRQQTSIPATPCYNSSACTYPSLTTAAAPNITQRAFIFTNDDGANVGSSTSMEAANTTTTNVVEGQRMGVRFQIDNTGGTAKSTAYKIQYDHNDGVWADLDFGGRPDTNTGANYGDWNVATPDSTGSVGTSTSVAIGTDGNPVVAYYDSSNSNLNILKCGNSSCTAGNSTTTPDSTGSVGSYTSLAIGTDGNPVVAYYDEDNKTLKILKCGNSACTTGNSVTTADNIGWVGQYTSLAIGTDGNPVVAYLDWGNGWLKILKCGNSSCTSGNTKTTVDTKVWVGQYTSLAIGTDGNPVVAYYNYSSSDLNILKCGDSACTSGNTTTTVESVNVVGQYTSLAIGTDGNPVVAYYDGTNGNLNILKCGNSACTAGNSTTIPDSTGSVGSYTSLAIGTDGNPVVAYYDSTNLNLKIAKQLPLVELQPSWGLSGATGGVLTSTSTGICYTGTSWQNGVWYEASTTSGVISLSANTCTELSFMIDTSEAVASTTYRMRLVYSNGNALDYYQTYPAFSLAPKTTNTKRYSKDAVMTSASSCTATDYNCTNLTGLPGWLNAIAIGEDGNPVIASIPTNAGGVTEFAITKCNDTACSGGDEASTTIDSTVNDSLSIAIGSDGYPVVVYRDPSVSANIRVAKCNDAACSSAATSTVITDGGDYYAIAIGKDGYPVIAYYDQSALSVKLAKCNDAACSSAATINTVDAAGGSYVSLAIGNDGYPVVAYRYSNSNLKVAKCNDAACSSAATVTTLDTVTSYIVGTSVAIGIDGYPIIAYWHYDDDALKVAKCNDAACSSAPTVTIIDDMAGTNTVGYSNIAIGTDGYPVIAYGSYTTDALKLAKCNGLDCSSPATITTIDDMSQTNVYEYSSLAIGNDGYPVIAYYNNTTKNLKVAKGLGLPKTAISYFNRYIKGDNQIKLTRHLWDNATTGAMWLNDSPAIEDGLTYWMDKSSYTAVASNDTSFDNSTSTGSTSTSTSVFVFSDEHASSTQLLSVQWIGQSTVNASSNNIKLEVYRFSSSSSTTGWYTIATDSSCVAGNTCTISGSTTTDLTDFYFPYYGFSRSDATTSNEYSFWTFWRVYQDPPTGATVSQTLKTNYWNPTAPPPTVSVSGTVYTNEGDTNIGANKTVILKINGADACSGLCTAETNVSGAYSISNVTIGAVNDVITVFLSDEPEKAVTVSKASSTIANITGLDLYKNRVIVRDQGSPATSLTITNMSVYDSTLNSNIPFTAIAATSLTVATSSKLYIWPDKTFNPGGTITTLGNAQAAPGGDLQIASGATLTAGGNISVSGNWIASSTSVFTPGAYTVTMTATTTGKQIWESQSNGSFYNLTFAGSGGTAGAWAFQTDATTTNNFIISNGSVTSTSGILSVGGNFSNAGTFNHNSGTVNFYGTTSATLDSGCANVDTCTNGYFYNVTIDKTDANDANDNLTLSTSHLRIQNTLTITDGELIQATSGVDLSVRSEGYNAVSVAAAGKWTNTGRGDVILGSIFSNSGTVNFNSDGASCGGGGGIDYIYIHSTSTPYQTSWTGSSISMYNVEVKDQAGSAAITVYSGTNSLNNGANWTFSGCGINIAGTLYSNEGDTQITSGGITISLSVDGAATQSTTTNSGSGAWHIDSVSGVYSSVPITLFVDNNGSIKAATVTTASSSDGNIAGLDLYQNRLIVRQEATSGTSTDIADMARYDNSRDSDIMFTATTTNGTATTTTIFSGNKLYIWPNKTFAPGGTVIVDGNADASPSGDLQIALGATLTAGGNISVAGSWIASSTATFTPDTYTVTMTATTTGKKIYTPSLTANFKELTFGSGGTSGGWAFQTDATVTANFTINSNMTVTAPSGTLYVGSNWANYGTFIHNSGRVWLNSLSSGRTVIDGGSPFYNLTFDGIVGSSGVWLYQNGAAVAPNQTTVTNGTVTFLNAKTGPSPSVTGAGELLVDWYLGVNIVNAATTTTNIDTVTCNDISISEGTASSTIWRYIGGWGSAFNSTTTGTGVSCGGPSAGINPQPNNTGAIRIREYRKTATAANYYKYNLSVVWQTNWGEYNYYTDYGSNYLTSSSSSETTGVDKTIGEGWWRSSAGTINSPYTCAEGSASQCINNAPTNGSWYVGMLSGLIFEIPSGFSVNLGNLDSTNNYTATASSTLKVWTSATNGYVVTAWALNNARMKQTTADIYINTWGGTNSSPTNWDGDCPNNSECGFGYNTNDDSLSGNPTLDRFVTNPTCGTDDRCWAGFASAGAGDPVADSSAPTSSDTTIVRYKVSAPVSQAAGSYQTTIIYIITANY